MESTVEWNAPGPGPWQQDSAHTPVAQTRIMQRLYPQGFNRGFTETFAVYGVLLDRLALGVVNGFTYHQPQPFDLPGPDGPKDPEWIAAEFGRRVGVAAQAFEKKIWRDAIAEWDGVDKPASIARHHELDVDFSALDDAQLGVHIDTCVAHVIAMVYQHHRYNSHALVPVGDFLINALKWTGQPVAALLAVFDGHSPVSNVVAPEMERALTALRADVEAQEILAGAGDAADVLARLRSRLPEVGEYIDAVHFRVMDGFDISNPTIGERPQAIVGRLACALNVDTDDAKERSAAAAASLREMVPTENRPTFDDLLGEARLVYRLRDERGIYSEISAIGLLRLALLEFGSRLEHAGRIHEADDVLDAGLDEIQALIVGADMPSASELHQRGIDRLNLTLEGPPRYLGDPPPPPPSTEGLPPPMARLMSSLGFMIDGVLGQMEVPEGNATTVIGISGAQGTYEGAVRVVRSVDDLLDLEQGDVLVAPTTGEAFNSMLHLVGAIVTDHGSFVSHAAIVSREMGIPAVVGTIDGTRRLAAAKRVRVDGTAGRVTILE